VDDVLDVHGVTQPWVFVLRFRSVRTLINDRLPAFRTIEHRAKAALAERTSALARIGEGMVMVIASFWV
ncbi:hypothetical protein, partial [Mesorhizobium sp. M7A.F.Ca.CA.004.11.2.1]|uniref:hypothetical protein n=1 Tax=Mesorhizobium sp. M7A.F.Ca.CA.004.11.2.1 TaxID=2496699 RepID=UPI0019D02509